jgi:hypothetical protein
MMKLRPHVTQVIIGHRWRRLTWSAAPFCLPHREPAPHHRGRGVASNIGGSQYITSADVSLDRDRLLVGLRVESTDPDTMCGATARLGYGGCGARRRAQRPGCFALVLRSQAAAG